MLRDNFDEAISYIFTTIHQKYKVFNFYGYLLSQCNVEIDENYHNIAGIGFINNTWVLKIGNLFGNLPLDHRVGILVHEMLHILYNHQGRREDRDPELFNIASDCAINQQITREFLPDFGVFPEGFNPPLPMNLDAEQYYELLLQKSKNPENPKNNPENDSDNSDNKDDGSNKEQNNKKDSGTPKLSDIQSNIQLDDHDLWNERCETSNKNLQKASIANMIKNAVDNTIASRGVIPNNISKIIELHIQEPVVMWQQELKNIVGERRSDRTKTHKRPNRRFPNRMELRGNKKDELFTLVCILDVSGSHNTTSIINGLSEVRELCKITSSTIKIIQVDTQVHSVDEFDINTTSITRKANGGTEIYPAIEYIYKNDIEHDVIVVITDGGIESLRSWRYHPSCRVIFLVTDDIDIPNLADYNYSQFSIVQ